MYWGGDEEREQLGMHVAGYLIRLRISAFRILKKHERWRSHGRRFLFIARRTREHPTHRRLQLCFEPLRDLCLRETDMERVRRARISVA